MSRHLLALFAILAISCTMTLGGVIDNAGKAISDLDVKVERDEHAEKDNEKQIELDHEEHKKDGHGEHHEVGHVEKHELSHEEHLEHEQLELHEHDEKDHGDKCCDGQDHHDQKDCDKHKCPKNEMWSNCGAGCQATCKNRKPVCPLVCLAGCVCNSGLVRNEQGKCVEECNC